MSERNPTSFQPMSSTVKRTTCGCAFLLCSSLRRRRRKKRMMAPKRTRPATPTPHGAIAVPEAALNCFVGRRVACAPPPLAAARRRPARRAHQQSSPPHARPTASSPPPPPTITAAAAAAAPVAAPGLHPLLPTGPLRSETKGSSSLAQPCRPCRCCSQTALPLSKDRPHHRRI